MCRSLKAKLSSSTVEVVSKSLGFNVVASSTSLLRTLSVLISISTVSVFVVVSSSPEVVVSNSLVIAVSSVESDDRDEDG